MVQMVKAAILRIINFRALGVPSSLLGLLVNKHSRKPDGERS